MTVTTDVRGAVEAALGDGTRCLLNLSSPVELPVVRVQKIGGAAQPASNKTSMLPSLRALFSVHCWAATIVDAEVLAERVRVAIHALPAVTSWCLAVEEQGAPALVWDDSRPERAIPRFVLTAEVAYRA